MKFSLTAGTMLRHGARTLEVVRQLNDNEFQLEDVLTRRPSVKTLTELLNGIWNKAYEVVLPGIAAGASPDEERTVDIAQDLSSLQERDRLEIEKKLAYIKGLYAGKVTRGQRAQAAKAIATTHARRKKEAEDANEKFTEKKPSASSVMAWTRVYEESGCCPMALKSGNSSRKRETQLDPQLEHLMSKLIREVYLTRDRHTLQHTLDRIHEEADKLVKVRKLDPASSRTSIATLSRRVRNIDRYVREKARYGEARARMICRTTMDGAGASYPLERVEVDHTVLNWVAICDRTGLPLGKPTLTVMLDAYSGYVIGMYLSFYGPGLTSVSGVIRNAVTPKAAFTEGIELEHPWLSHGIPDLLILDNGLEFHSRSFKLMAWELGCDLTYCRVRTPWLKPHVERFFGSLNYLTLAKGRVHKRMASVLNIDPLKDAAIRFSDLVKGLTMFISDVHPFEVNERKLARPFDLFSEGLSSCPPAEFPGSWDQLRLVSALSKRLTVGPGGVELHGLPYGGPELLQLRHRYGESIKTMVKWDPDDMQFIYIQDPETYAWIQSGCRWPEASVGVSWNQHLLTRRFQRAELKDKDAREGLRLARLRLHEHWLNATTHSTQKQAQLAGRVSGVTSARITNPPTVAMPVDKIVARIDVPAAVEVDVPDFETFEM